jgi:hypothetical protein
MPGKKGNKKSSKNASSGGTSQSRASTSTQSASLVNINGVRVPSTDPNLAALQRRAEARKQKRDERLKEIDVLKEVVSYT